MVGRSHGGRLQCPPVKPARVALTFDDGPSPHTEAIADLIARHGGAGTFFVLGDKVAGQEPLLRRMVAAGHELGNHTYSHPHCGRLEEGALREELARAQQAITDASGRTPVLVRPPYGEDAERVGAVGAEIGLDCILWDVDPIDWRERSVERIVRRVLDGIRDRAIVDFHDGWPSHHTGIRDRTPTVDALREILPELVRRGYEPVTVSAMSAQPATQTSSSS
jgi:peptidoglycan/xylan/chitin deacetylase (PgdA/CDA1 family)